jgi:hypothetical protein
MWEPIHKGGGVISLITNIEGDLLYGKYEGLYPGYTATATQDWKNHNCGENISDKGFIVLEYITALTEDQLVIELL